MPNPHVQAAGEAPPGDNRSALVRLTDDIASLAYMASIMSSMIERALDLKSSIEHDRERDIYTFQIAGDATDEMHFAASDVVERARSIRGRVDLLGGAAALKTEPSKRFGLLSDLESAIGQISGFVDAIDGLSSGKGDPARSLASICAIAVPAKDECERADQAVRDLYELHFAEKSTG